jgi:hypothetical protein
MGAVAGIFRDSLVLAEPPVLAFKASGQGCYEFDTGLVRGKLRGECPWQGISSLVHVATGVELVHAQYHGMFSPYWINSTGTNHGEARTWPSTSRLLDDGAVEVRWLPAEKHPLELIAVYRWRRADTLDLQMTVKPQQNMPRFEVYLASYFAEGCRALVYAKPSQFSAGEHPCFLPADVNPLIRGSYLIFPQSYEAVQTIFDGRWKWMAWSVTRFLAAPVGIRRHEKSGVTVSLMALPEDCFAVATPYNSPTPDGVSDHGSMYLCMFGRDIQAGHEARARARLIVAKDLSDEQVIERFGEYRQEMRQ